jgi:hypothetical protein
LPAIAGGDVGVRVVEYRVIEEVERFGPALEQKTLDQRGGGSK